jgi:hypothetical protein
LRLSEGGAPWSPDDYTVRMLSFPMRVRGLLPTVACLAAVLVACVPAATTEALAGPAAQALERTASEAFHRMELGRLRTGGYTTNVLVDVDLPQGARVTVEAFSGDDYRLRVDSDAVEGVVWFVSPRGVRRVIQR